MANTATKHLLALHFSTFQCLHILFVLLQCKKIQIKISKYFSQGVVVCFRLFSLGYCLPLFFHFFIFLFLWHMPCCFHTLLFFWLASYCCFSSSTTSNHTHSKPLLSVQPVQHQHLHKDKKKCCFFIKST